VLTPVVPHVKEGKLRALAVTTAKRSPALPDVPTLAEAGVPDQESDTMQGVLAPTGTPEPIIAVLHREIDKAMTEPEVAQKMAALGFEKIASTPDEFARRIRADIPKWAKVIQTANIRVE
jgi:tripartite-type tricarboxylate transporter receptor subunit TctC